MRYFSGKMSVILFCTILFLPLAGMMSGQKQYVSIQEKRALTPFPSLQFDRKSIQEFPASFERYFNDHFGFRSFLISLHNYYKVFVLHVSPVKKVVIGKDGWLFFNENNMIGDFMGQVSYSRKEVGNMVSAFRERAGISRYFGSKYLFVLAPNKQSIYPEYLPDHIRYAKGISKAEKLIKVLKAMSVVPIVDLRDDIRGVKREFDPLYLLKDTHWNQRGAFLAYKCVMKKLQEFQWVPEVDSLTKEMLTITMVRSKRGDLAEMIGMKDVMPENTEFLAVKNAQATRDSDFMKYLSKQSARYITDSRRPIVMKNPRGNYNVVLFRDSFSTDMIPYYAESFKRMVIFYEPFNADLLADLMKNTDFRPDVVIEEMIERYL